MNTYELFGLSAICLLCLLLLIVLYLWPQEQGRHLTFSHHAASSRNATVFYAFIFALTLPVLAWVTASYLTPKYQLDALATIIISVATLLQIACTLFPLRGRTTRIHHTLALSSAGLLWILLLNFGHHGTLPVVVIQLIWIVVVGMLAVAAVGLFHRRYALWYQIAYYLMFFAAYIAILVS